MKIIQGTKNTLNRKPDIQMLYRAIERIMLREGGYLTFQTIADYAGQYRDEFKRLLFLKVLVAIERSKEEKSITVEMAEADFLFVALILEMFKYLTPNELLYMFPVEKEYDGEKYGMKDYFYTMNSVNKLDRDSCIGDDKKVLDLLWDYQNKHINHFMVFWMQSISHIKQFQGGMNPLEEVMLENGIPTYTIHEKEGYIYNRMTGEVTPVRRCKKRIPKYLKVVKTKEKEQTQ